MAGEAIVQLMNAPIGMVETGNGALVALRLEQVSVVTVGLQGPPGVDGARPVLNETPAGVVNGSNATFTTAFAFVPGQVSVRINGLSQRPLIDFTTTGTQTILFTESPLVGDSLQVDYLRA